VMGADGSNLKMLTHTKSDPGNLSDNRPIWQPDGEHLAFRRRESPKSGGSDIYTMDVDGSNKTNITKSPGVHELNFDFSPDGSQMCSFRSITQELKADPNSGSFVAEVPGGDHISIVIVEFYGELDWGTGDTQATSYCFESKGLAADALRGHVHRPTLAGETDNCYVAVYEGSGPSLNP
jgi:WD40-like Beta Propeller Repeat